MNELTAQTALEKLDSLEYLLHNPDLNGLGEPIPFYQQNKFWLGILGILRYLIMR